MTAVNHDSPFHFEKILGGSGSAAMNQMSLFQQVKKPGISVIQKPDEWVLIEVTVDSGACVTVMPAGMCLHIGILQSALTRDCVEYEVANGQSIPNLGERKCEVMTAGSSVPKRITF